MQWKFKEQAPDAPSADFNIYEHFNDNEVDALVREVLQNSIDAKREDEKRVSVNFTFGTASDTFRDENFGNGLPQHLSMTNALDYDDKDEFEKLRHVFDDDKWITSLDYLLIEDYGTYGLAGDHTRMMKKELKPGTTTETKASINNRFRMFHWDWGGHKGEDTTFGGSWGYGKAALTLCSKIKTILTLSTRNKVPNDDSTREQSLFGHCIISPHFNETKNFYYFGHYCLENESDTLPHSSIVNGKEVLEKFRNEIGSKRTDTKEHLGLSVVIPWPKQEFTTGSIIRSVIRNFSFALQKDLLEVTVSNPSKSITLDKSTNLKLIQNPDVKWEENNIDTTELINLHSLLSSSVVPLELTLPDNSGYDISKLIEQIPENEQQQWYEYFNDPSNEKMKKVKITLPLWNKKSGKVSHGNFETTFIMQHDSNQTFFQRHVIRVLDNEMKTNAKSPNVVALTHIDNDIGNELHTFLRSAEGPSHMEWNVSRSRAKRWDTPTNILRFITNFVPRFVEAFSVGRESEPKALGWLQFPSPKNRKKPAFPKKPIMPKELVEGSPLKASRIDSGIRFTPKDSKSIDIGMKIVIEVAYEMRKGNPFSKWEKEDFEMKDLTITQSGIINIVRNNNTLTFEVSHLDVEINISGFHPMYERVAKNREIKGVA